MKAMGNLFRILVLIPFLLLNYEGMLIATSFTESGYQHHFPIYITHDVDFEYFDFAGSGSPDDPYIIEGLEISGYAYAIEISHVSSSFVIRDCVLSASSFDSGSVVSLQQVTDFKIQDCDIRSGYYGIHLMSCENTAIIGNRIYDCSRGVSISVIVNGNVSSNSIFGNGVGINMGGTSLNSFCLFTHNSVYKNTVRGIDIAAGWNNTFHSNKIGWNGEVVWPNVHDNGLNNTWDDGVSQGNYWNDYVGFGDYEIPGDAESVDRYPSLLEDDVAPTIDHPPDIQIEHGDDHTDLVWTPFDEYPHEFVINMDGNLYDMGVWNGQEITVPLDDLEIGTYNFSLRVYDAEERMVSDSVMVQVNQPILGFTSDPVLPIVVVSAVAVIVILVMLRNKWA